MADSLIRTSGLPGARSAAQWALLFSQYTAASKDLAQPFDLGLIGIEGVFWPNAGPGGRIAERLSDWLGAPEESTADLDADILQLEASLKRFVNLLNARDAARLTDDL